MRIALAQLNPTVGDVAGNTKLVLEAIEAARRDRADLVVCSELVLIAYPPRDLLLREGIVESCEAALQPIAAAAGEMVVLVGHPRRVVGGSRPFRNSVSALSRGHIIATYDKRLLPGYDVFDEDRYFDSGAQPCVINVAGQRVGILICEDLWRAEDVRTERRYDCEPVPETIALGCDLLVTLNGSPFVLGKFEKHISQLQRIARDHRVPVVSVNQVGGNDDLIFDGRSVILDETGTIRDAVPGWIQTTRTFTVPSTVGRPPSVGSGNGAPRVELLPVNPLADLFNALVLGVRDYCRKTGHRQALIGLSGGIDSALTAAIAVAALGPRHVSGLILPSQHSSARSHADALALVKNLGMTDCRELSIEKLHESARSTLAPSLHERLEGITDENLQTRLRGLLLMAHANALNAFVLATGNKSELATGYCTLYGDMCGALALLGDVLKTTVYQLANWLNANHAACGFAHPPIPEESITRVPTAELRPNQTDQDTLPPYDVLDQIIQRFIELEQSPQRIIAETGLDAALVQRWCRIIDQQQYKRDQAAIVLKVSPRSFGRGRPMPAASKVAALPAATAESRAAVQAAPPSVLQSGM